jgi:hypothetical protein
VGREKKKEKKERRDILENEMLACATILVFQNTRRTFARKIFIKIRHRV